MATGTVQIRATTPQQVVDRLRLIWPTWPDWALLLIIDNSLGQQLGLNKGYFVKVHTPDTLFLRVFPGEVFNAPAVEHNGRGQTWAALLAYAKPLTAPNVTALPDVVVPAVNLQQPEELPVPVIAPTLYPSLSLLPFGLFMLQQADQFPNLFAE